MTSLQTIPPLSLIEYYRRLIEKEQLSYNSAQNFVVESLSLLSHRLEHYTPPSEVGYLSALFGKPQQTVKGLYIFGGVGSGKTMLMDLFFNTLKVRKKKRYHFSAFMEYIHHEIKQARKQDLNDPIQAAADKLIAQTVILCLDEFQVTDITDAMILSRLFEALFAQGLILVTTSNIPPNDLYEDGLNRPLFLPFIDLLTHHSDIIELEIGHDYRRQAITKHTLWYVAPSAKQNLPYLTHWETLTAGFSLRSDTLIVHNRPIKIPYCAGKIARFSFEDLCEKPLGRADYLAIAHKYSTIFIDDIPIMSVDQKNEARRFILLIDSFYDEGIILIASSPTQPDTLFTKGQSTEEFKRTISRLLEMSSQKYLGAYFS